MGTSLEITKQPVIKFRRLCYNERRMKYTIEFASIDKLNIGKH